jgi:hypothetical protein
MARHRGCQRDRTNRVRARPVHHPGRAASVGVSRLFETRPDTAESVITDRGACNPRDHARHPRDRRRLRLRGGHRPRRSDARGRSVRRRFQLAAIIDAVRHWSGRASAWPGDRASDRFASRPQPTRPPDGRAAMAASGSRTVSAIDARRSYRARHGPGLVVPDRAGDHAAAGFARVPPDPPGARGAGSRIPVPLRRRSTRGPGFQV